MAPQLLQLIVQSLRKVTPTGTGDKTEGLQGQVQEGKVTFTPGHDSVPFPADSTPLFDNGTAVKEVPNVGKFEVDADGKVTFLLINSSRVKHQSLN